MLKDTMIFAPSRSGRESTDSMDELLSALDHQFLSIAKLELDTGRAWLLHSLGQQNRACYEFDWEKYLDFYQTILEPDEVPRLFAQFSISGLKAFYIDRKRQYSRYFVCLPETGLDCMEIIAQFTHKNGKPAVYIFTRPSGDSYLLRRIIDLYVYNNCDYFLYLDAKNNSYTMFSGSKNGTPLPPAVCSDYSSEIVKYADTFVVPEDREMVIREMNLDRVLSVLENHEIHAFTCGVWQEGIGYTRKRLEYRYYNKPQQMILLSRSDITEIYTEQKQHAQDLEAALEQALTDPLTKLLNFQGIQTTVKKELAHSNDMAALLFLDLDDFKSINDTYGHSAGNDALQSVASILRENIRSSDHAARIGGDEFVVFLSNIQSVENAADCARRICERLSQVQIEDFRLSCSIGVSFAPADGTNYTSLVNKADAKVYEAKSRGKNQFAI